MVPTPIDPRLLAKYSDISDQESLLALAAQILDEAHSEGRSGPDAAYAYLHANSSIITKRRSALDPSALIYWRAVDLANSHLYWQAVCSQVDASRLRQCYAELQAHALAQGGGTVDGALSWMASELPRLLQENISSHPDWVVRNRAWGFVQKRSQFERNLGPQQPPDWDKMAAPRDPPFAVLSA